MWRLLLPLVVEAWPVCSGRKGGLFAGYHHGYVCTLEKRVDGESRPIKRKTHAFWQQLVLLGERYLEFHFQSHGSLPEPSMLEYAITDFQNAALSSSSRNYSYPDLYIP